MLSNRSKKALLAAVAGILGASSLASATTGTWNQTAASTTRDWMLATNWTGGIPLLANDIANINNNSAGAQTISLNNAVSLATLNIGDSTSSFFGFTIANGTGSGLTFDAGASNAQINKGGSGTTTGDTISASLFLNSNLVVSNTSNSILTLSGAINDGSNGAKAVTYTTNTAGSLKGQYIVSGGNGYSGGTTINNVRVNPTNSNAFGTGTVTINSGGQIYLSSAVNITNNINVAGIGWTETTQPLQLGAIRMEGNAVISGNITMTGNTRFHTHGSGAGTINGSIGGNFTFEKAGTGTLTLNGDNTFTGGTSINTTGTGVAAGLLRLGHANALGNTPGLLTINGGIVEGTANYNSFTQTLAGSGAGNIRITGGTSGFSAFGAPVTVNIGNGGNPLIWGSTNFNPTVLVLNNTTATGTLDFQNAIDLNNTAAAVARTINVGANTATIAGNLSVSNSTAQTDLIKTGAGTLILNGTSSYNGTTTVSAGTLQVGSAAALGGTGRSVTVAAGASIVAGYAIDNAFLQRLANEAGTTLVLMGADSGNPLDFSNSAVGANLPNGTLGAVSNVTYSGVLTPNGANYRLGGGTGILTVASSLGGTQGLIVGGNISLTGVNSYAGKTVVSTGSLGINDEAALGAIPGSFVADQLTLNGGALRGTANLTINDANRGITIGASGGTVDADLGTTMTIANTISGGGSLTKIGQGTVALGGTGNSFNAVNARFGTLEFASGSTTVAGNFTIGDTANSAGAVLVSGGALTVDGGNLLLANTNPSTGTYTQTGGTVVFNGTAFLGVSNNSGPSTFTVSGGSFTSTSINMNLGVRGAGQLNISGAGTVSLPGVVYAHPSTSGGVSEIFLGDGVNFVGGNSGTLTVRQISRANGTANFTFNGGTLRVASDTSATQAAAFMANLSAGVVADFGGVIDTNGVDVTIAQPFMHGGINVTDGGLTKIGAGTLTLTGASSYNGPTTVNAGTLRVSDVTSFASNIINNTSVELGGTTTWSLPTSISGTGTVTKVGTGTASLSVAQTYTGQTRVNEGTLNLDFFAFGAVTDNIIAFSGTTPALAMGGGTLQMSGAFATGNTQSFNGLALNSGRSRISLTSNAMPLRLTVGAITRQAGGLIDFSLPAGTQDASNGVVTTATNTNGILGGYATVNGTDWASVNGTGNVVAYTAYTDVDRLGGTIADAAATNVRIIEAGVGTDIALGAATTTINTLLQSATGGTATIDTAGKTLRLGTTGGLLLPATAGGLTLGLLPGDGTLTAGGAADTPGELAFQNLSTNVVTVNAVVADNGTGAVALSKNGAGAMVLAGANTHTGATAVGSGALTIQHATALGATTAGTTVANGAALELQGGITVGNEALSITGSGIALGGALRNVSGSNTWNGPITMGPGTLINNAGGSLTLNGTITLGATPVLRNTSGTLTVNGKLTGTGNLTLAGPGFANPIYINNGTSDYAGTTTILGSANTDISTVTKVVLGANNALPADTRLTINNGFMYLNGFTQTLAQLTGNNSVSVRNGSTTKGTLYLKLVADSVPGNLGHISSFNGPGDDAVQNTNFDLIVEGVSGARWVSMNGNANTYSGKTTVKPGGGLSMNTAAQAWQVAPAAYLADSLTMDGGAIRNASGVAPTVAANHGITITAAGGWFSPWNSQTITVQSKITGAGALNVNQDTGTLVLSSTGNDYAGNTVVGQRYVGFNAAGTPTLQLGAANVIPDGAGKGNVIVQRNDGFNSTLNLAGFSETINGLSGDGTITNSSATAATFTVGNNDASGSFSGTLLAGSGAINLIKTGTGTLTLGGNNTYTGTTVVNGGTLTLGGTNASTAALTVNAGSLILTGSGATASNNISIASGATLDSSAAAAALNLTTGRTLTIGRSGAATTDLTGNLTLSGGTLNVGGTAQPRTLTQAGHLALSGGTLALDLGDAITPGAGVSDLIAVSGNLNLSGTTTIQPTLVNGTLASGSYTLITYGGGLTGDASNLSLGIPAGSRLTVGLDTTTTAGSVLMNVSGTAANLVWTGAVNNTWDLNTTANFNGADNKFWNLDRVTFNDSAPASATTVSVPAAITPGAILVDSSANAYTLGGAGAISGSMKLTKSGSSALTMQGTHAWTGGTVLSQGELRIQGASALGTGPVTLGDAATGSGNIAFYLDAVRQRHTAGVIVSAQGTGTVTLGSRSNIGGAADDNGFTNITLNRDVIFESNANDRTDYRNISGTGNITIAGTGRSVFTSSPNTFVGNVTIATTGNGQLQIGAATASAYDAIPDASNLTVQAGALLRMSATSERINGLYGAGNINVNSINSTLIAAEGNFSGILQNAGTNTLALTKVGPGSLTLSGANTATGGVNVLGGTLVIGATNTVQSTSKITLGDTTGNAGTLDMTGFSQTLGSFAVSTIGPAVNTVTIAPGRTLTVNGAVNIGPNAAGVTKASLTGGGAFLVSSAGALFQVGGALTTTAPNEASLDLSGLSTFTAHLGATGIFRVGDNSTSSLGGTFNSTVTLAPNSTITAATIGIGSEAGSGFYHGNLRLGSGSNILNANTVNIGLSIDTGARSHGHLLFDGATGTLRIRAADGNGRAALNILKHNNATGVIFDGVSADLAGHQADLLLTTLNVGVRSNGTNASASGMSNTFLTFDAGILDAQAVNLAHKTGGNIYTGVMASNHIDIGGGTVNFGPTDIARNDTASGTVEGTLNISGGNVAIASINFATASQTGGAAVGTLNFTGGTITLAGDITKSGGSGSATASLTLDGATLDMGNKALGSFTPIDNLALKSGTLRNVASINGSGGLTKTSPGTLILAGTVGYSGPTAISQGTLQVGEGGATGSLGSSTSDIVNNGTLIFNRSDSGLTALSLANKITGTGSLVQAGAGTTILKGPSDYAGTTTINAGTLQVGDGSTSGATLGAGAVTNNANLHFNLAIGEVHALNPSITGTGTTTVSNGRAALAAAGTLTTHLVINDGGSFDATAAGGFTIPTGKSLTAGHTGAGPDILGNLTLGAATINVGPATSTSPRTLSLANNLTLTGGGTMKLDLSANTGFGNDQAAVTGTLTASGVTTVNITPMTGPLGVGTYTLISYNPAGSTASNANFALVSNLISDTRITGQSLNVNNTTGVVELITTGDAPASLTWVGDGAGNAWDLHTTPNFTGGPVGDPNRFYNLDSVTFGDAANRTVNLTGTLRPSSVTVSNSTGNYTFAGTGSLAGTTGLTLSGVGLVDLRTANTFTGDTQINSGTLVLGNPLAVQNSTVRFSSANALVFDIGATTYTLGGLDASGDIVLVNGLLAPVDLRVGNNNADTSFSGVLSGAGSLTKIGTGTLTLSGVTPHTFTGGTAITSGAVKLGSGSVLENSTVTVNAANGLQFAFGGPYTLGGLAGSAGFTLADTTSTAVELRVGNNNADTSFSGVLSGTGGLTKLGAGTLTLAGASTYTGATQINGGVLSVSSVANGGAASPLGASSSAAANLQLDGGTLRYTGASASTDRGMTLNTAGGTIEVSSAATTLGVGGIAGSGGLTKTGPGTLQLTAAGTYAGTTISNGTVSVRYNDTALGGGTVTLGDASTGNSNIALLIDHKRIIANPIVVAANPGSTGTVTIGHDQNGGVQGENTQFTGPITLNRSVIFDSGNEPDRLDIAGAISGTADITVAGGKRVSFSNQTNSFVGSVSITGAGTILQTIGGSGVTATTVIPDATPVAVGTGAVLNVFTDETIGGLSGTGTVRPHDGSGARSSILSVGGGDATASFGGSFIGTTVGTTSYTVSLVKIGAGTQTLSGTSPTIGALTVNGGTVNIPGGSHTTSGDFIVGNLAGATTAFTMSDGSLTVNGGQFLLGQNATSGPSTYTQTGGTVTFTGGTSLNLSNFGGPSTMTVSGGSLTMTSATVPLRVGIRATATLNVSGPGIVTTSSLIFGHPSTNGGNVPSYINLGDGTTFSGGSSGVIATNSVAFNFTAGSTSTSILNFNGGTLRARSANATFISGLTSANILESGAIIDSNGFDITIPQPLLHGGAAATDGGLTKKSAGILTLPGTHTYTGPTNVDGGTLRLTGSIDASSGVNVAAGATLDLAATRGLKALTLAGAADAWTGKVDLRDNDLVIRSGPLAPILNQLKQGRNGGIWKAPAGFTSSVAAGITGLAAIRNSDDDVNPLMATFSGIAVDKDSILVKYTYNGDADLSGVIDIDDYFQIDVNYGRGTPNPTYRQGDYNYSGAINADDYFLIDAAFIGQTGPLSGGAPAAPTAAVPEPATLSLLMLGAAALLGRRRRSR